MGLNQRQLNASKKKWYYIVPAAVLGLCAVLSYFFLDDAIFQLVLKNRQQLRDIAWLGQLRIMGKTEGQLFVFCFWGWACRKARPIIYSVYALVISAISINIIKLFVHRPRPFHVLENTQLDFFDSTSFPSADTTTIFAIITVIVLMTNWRWAILFYTTAALIGIQRITSFAHYPSDVMAGAAFGILTGWGLVRFKKNEPFQNFVKSPNALKLMLLTSFISFWIIISKRPENLYEFIIVYVIMLTLICVLNRESFIYSHTEIESQNG